MRNKVAACAVLAVVVLSSVASACVFCDRLCTMVLHCVLSYLALGIFVTFMAALAYVPYRVSVLVDRLAKTRNAWRTEAPVGGGGPWSCRLYSAAKRATLAWCAAISLCVATFVFACISGSCLLPGSVLYWGLAAVPVAVFVWGYARPRMYVDGADRVANGRRKAWTGLAGLLFLVFSFAFVFSQSVARNLVAWRSVDYGNGVMDIHAAEWSAGKFWVAPVASEMIPPKAKDIDFSYHPTLPLTKFGGDAKLRCKVAKDDLLSFAKWRGYSFQSESMELNSCRSGCGDIDFVGSVLHEYGGHYPSRFLAYNYRGSDCGGYSFLYDEDEKTLYACWSSN